MAQLEHGLRPGWPLREKPQEHVPRLHGTFFDGKTPAQREGGLDHSRVQFQGRLGISPRRLRLAEFQQRDGTAVIGLRVVRLECDGL